MVPCAEPNRTEPNRIEPNRPIDRPTEPTDPTTEEVRHFLTFVFDNQCRGQARNRRAPTGQLFARSSADSPPEGFTASEGEEKHPHRCRSRRHSHGPVARVSVKPNSRVCLPRAWRRVRSLLFHPGLFKKYISRVSSPSSLIRQGRNKNSRVRRRGNFVFRTSSSKLMEEVFFREDFLFSPLSLSLFSSEREEIAYVHVRSTLRSPRITNDTTRLSIGCLFVS